MVCISRAENSMNNRVFRIHRLSTFPYTRHFQFSGSLHRSQARRLSRMPFEFSDWSLDQLVNKTKRAAKIARLVTGFIHSVWYPNL